MDDVEIDLRSSGFIFRSRWRCAVALDTGASAQGPRVVKHWLRLPLAEALHHEAESGYVDLHALREIA